jgi:Rad3-related DNA helicase
MADILSYFPPGLTPREGQRTALRHVQDSWDKVDVIVINLPVAAGKTAIAMTIAKWAYKEKQQRSRIITPTKVLVEQYKKDFPGLHTLGSMDSYTCHTMTSGTPDEPTSMSCMSVKKSCGRTCVGCVYIKEKKKTYAMPYSVHNNYVYMANDLHAPALIADEAHNLVDVIRSMAGKQIWQHLIGYPDSVNTYGQLLRWVEEAIPRQVVPAKKTQLEALKKELISGRTRYLIQRTTDMYRGQEKDCIKLLPVDIRDQPPVFWPKGKVEKIILMSATIGRKDIEQLGLDRRRVLFLETPSPIPPERRPLTLDLQFTMAYDGVETSVKELALYIKKLLKERPGRGFIHAPYSLASRLRPLLLYETRLRWHTKENKQAEFNKWKDSAKEKDDAVFVASGLYEGVNLAGDLGHWQLIAKVPWPSLAEPAIKYMSEMDPTWYANETIKVMAQAYGRICRGPEDYGETIITDTSFARLYNDYNELMPTWLREVVDVEETSKEQEDFFR